MNNANESSLPFSPLLPSFRNDGQRETKGTKEKQREGKGKEGGVCNAVVNPFP